MPRASSTTAHRYTCANDRASNTAVDANRQAGQNHGVGNGTVARATGEYVAKLTMQSHDRSGGRRAITSGTTVDEFPAG